MGQFEVTFLGTGTSQGVPVITCDCAVCQSENLKDKRLRTSVLLAVNDLHIVIDTGPDFRQQMLREKVKKLDAVLFTHEHKDHVSGMDDVRAFNYSAKKAIDIYASERVEVGLRREFHYVFAENPYPGIPKVNLHRIQSEPFEIANTPIIPINVMHHKLPVKAFRIGDFTYITDANYIAPEELKKIEGTKVLVINALRRTPHISHFTLDEALELIAHIGPDKAFITHISHLMGKHDDLENDLPANVYAAYDGLKVEISE